MREFLDSERDRINNELSAKDLNRKQIESIIQAEHPDGTLEDALSAYEQIMRNRKLDREYFAGAIELLKRARPYADRLSERGVVDYRQLESAIQQSSKIQKL